MKNELIVENGLNDVKPKLIYSRKSIGERKIELHREGWTTAEWTSVEGSALGQACVFAFPRY
jgi:hypothetical protein